MGILPACPKSRVRTARLSRRIGKDAQDRVLGYSQSSLRDWSVTPKPPQDSRPGLLSAVPSGLSSGPTGSHADSKAIQAEYGAARLKLCADTSMSFVQPGKPCPSFR